MPIGLIGRKCGMTRVFSEAGRSEPVTVLEIEHNRITQIKKPEKEGYSSIQVTTGQRKANRVKKPQAGHFIKAGSEAGQGLWEFRCEESECAEKRLNDSLTIDLFQVGQFVDVRSKSKGKGFAGTIKRYNFRSQPATHGTSLAHRTLGSTGQCQTPGKVMKGKKMPGQLGNKRCTVQNQKIIQIDKERHLILVKGGIPGSIGTDVLIIPSVKKVLEEK